MSIRMIDAVFQQGVFKPLQPVTLAENEPVKVVVWVEPPPVPAGRRSLFGALPALADVSDESLAWAQQLWEQGLEKQIQNRAGTNLVLLDPDAAKSFPDEPFVDHSLRAGVQS